MISLGAYALIASMGLFVMPKWSFMPYDVPRQTFVTLGAFALLAFAMAAEPALIAGFAAMLAPVLACWILACFFSPRPGMSAERAILNFSCIVAGLLASREPWSFTGLALIAGAGTIAALYGILQWHFKILFMKQIESVVNMDEACGFTRNVNFTGPWLVLTMLFTLKLLLDVGPIAGALLGACFAIQAYAIWCSKCRTAFLGLAAAFVYFGFMNLPGPMLYLGVVLFGIAILVGIRGKKERLFRMNSMKDRKAFLRIFWEAIKRRPAWGYGFNVVRTRVPQITREINERSGGKFLSPNNYETPVVRKAHNDVMQYACDAGLIGLAITIGTLTGVPNSLNVFSLGIVLVFLVMGLTFHQMYWLPTQCLFWLAWGSMVEPWHPFGDLSGVGSVYFFFMIFLALAIIQTVIRTQIADVFHWLGNWAKDKNRQKWFAKSVAASPGSIALLQGANELARLKQPKESAEWLHRLLDRYDGDTRMWIAVSCLAELYLATGSLRLSRIYHEEALAYWPEWVFSRKKIAWIDSLETQMEKK